jgi:hypothetical protein
MGAVAQKIPDALSEERMAVTPFALMFLSLDLMRVDVLRLIVGLVVVGDEMPVDLTVLVITARLHSVLVVTDPNAGIHQHAGCERRSLQITVPTPDGSSATIGSNLTTVVDGERMTTLASRTVSQDLENRLAITLVLRKTSYWILSHD